jgi:hypothetical protein
MVDNRVTRMCGPKETSVFIVMRSLGGRHIIKILVFFTYN